MYTFARDTLYMADNASVLRLKRVWRTTRGYLLTIKKQYATFLKPKLIIFTLIVLPDLQPRSEDPQLSLMEDKENKQIFTFERPELKKMTFLPKGLS